MLLQAQNNKGKLWIILSYQNNVSLKEVHTKSLKKALKPWNTQKLEKPALITRWAVVKFYMVGKFAGKEY